jgi:nickel-dependent lactate racemase
MGKALTIPWGAWYNSREELSIEFPDSWHAQIFPMRDAEDVTNTGAIESALQNPIGRAPIRRLAAGKSNAVLVVEDISRPTKCAPICEAILKELNEGGIPDSQITLIGAVGAHRPMTRTDYIKKIGEEVLERVNVENHHPYENLVYLGESKLRTPIYVNKTYYEAELKIAVSTVIPHPLAGFGGGAKTILPGVCGIETLAANHKAGFRNVGIGIGFITELRKDIEDVCSRIGLDFSVNIVSTSRRGIAGIYAGHFIQAHRRAVDRALQVYHTDIPKLDPKDRFSVGFFNLFPEDTELSQSLKGINSLMGAQPILQQRSPAVFMTAATEGRGYHSLQGETGARLYENWGQNPVLKTIMSSRPFYVFSPGATPADVHHYFPEQTELCRSFGDLVISLEEILGPNPKAAVFPSSILLF